MSMINGGPVRLSGSTSRQAMYRNDSARRQPEGVQPMEQSVEPLPRTLQSRDDDSGRSLPKKARSFAWVKWVIIVIIIALLGVAGWLFWSTQRSVASTIDTDKYQAVFLSNGQVYFGKLSIVTSEYMELKNVFYLERQLSATANTDTEADTAAQNEQNVADNNFQLLKYSDVLYGSEDAMIISKDDIIRFENLRTDGVVAKAIANRR